MNKALYIGSHLGTTIVFWLNVQLMSRRPCKTGTNVSGPPPPSRGQKAPLGIHKTVPCIRHPGRSTLGGSHPVLTVYTMDLVQTPFPPPLTTENSLKTHAM